jgi:hypothetical protein
MPLNKEQLWQVMKAAALLDPGLRDNFLRALASRLEGVSRPSNREIEGALRFRNMALPLVVACSTSRTGTLPGPNAASSLLVIPACNPVRHVP